LPFIFGKKEKKEGKKILCFKNISNIGKKNKLISPSSLSNPIEKYKVL